MPGFRPLPKKTSFRGENFQNFFRIKSTVRIRPSPAAPFAALMERRPLPDGEAVQEEGTMSRLRRRSTRKSIKAVAAKYGQSGVGNVVDSPFVSKISAPASWKTRRVSLLTLRKAPTSGG